MAEVISGRRSAGLPASRVVLGAGRGFELNQAYLPSLENATFLEAFHWCSAPAGVDRPRPRARWGGWMGTGHDGEFHGHYLSACARTIALSADRALAEKTAALVEALARYQQSSGSLWVGTVTERALADLLRLANSKQSPTTLCTSC